MRDYSIEELKEKYQDYGYKWDNDFNIIAIRNTKDNFDSFDDIIYVVWNRGIFKYTCTTNPGSYYLITKFLNPQGTAVVKPGQYIDSWQLGLHRGHSALIQCRPITVWRDDNRDQKSGGAGLVYDTGMFGIDVHNTYGINAVVTKIFNWSAGCLVLNNTVEFKDFLSKCIQSKKKYFTITLIESW